MRSVLDLDRGLASSLIAAARRFGTPVAVTDVGTLEADATAVEAAFPDPWLRAFSVKANDVPAIVARLGRLGWGANVVSRGEWAVARMAGVPDHLVTLEGVGKTDADLTAAIRSAAAGRPIRWIAIESIDEARALVRIARRIPHGPAALPLDVLFRLNPEVVPETQPGLAVGARGSKFGIAADELTEAVGIVDGAAGRLRARGIHLHVGSQLGAVDAWRDAVRRGLAVLALLRGTRPDFDTLDVGGGFPVRRENPVPGPARFAAELPDLLAAIPAARRPTRLAIEPGRALVARSGTLVARVLHARERGGRQVVLDAGMTELIRPALYGAHHEVVALTAMGREVRSRSGAAVEASSPEPPAAPTRVEGPICESTDSLGEHDLPPLHRGDLVAILDTGAYAASLGSTYNGRPAPPQVLREPDGRLLLARRRGVR